MHNQTTSDFLVGWAIKVSLISDRLGELINAIREKDSECSGAFLEFHRVIKEIYPSIGILDCVHMISESVIIAPIKEILFDPKANKLDAHPQQYEQKIIAALKPYKIAHVTDELKPMYALIQSKSLQIDRGQLINYIYEDFFSLALPNRVARHKKVFGL